jgi:hypothetical protein
MVEKVVPGSYHSTFGLKLGLVLSEFHVEILLVCHEDLSIFLVDLVFDLSLVIQELGMSFVHPV